MPVLSDIIYQEMITMSLQSELMGAVHSAMADALQKTQENWKQAPELTNTVSLTGTAMSTYSDMSEGELTFETHRQKIPVVQRNMYGVAGKVHAARRSGLHGAGTDPRTLMQKTEKVLESSFIDSLETHL